MQNEGCDSQDSRNSDFLCLEDDLSKDLQEIIALEKIKSAPKSRKRGVTEYTYGSCGRVYSNPPRPRSKQKNMSRNYVRVWVEFKVCAIVLSALPPERNRLMKL